MEVEYITDYIYKSTTGFNSKNIAMVNEEYKQPYYLINEEGKKINDKTYKSAEMLLDGKFVVMLEDGKHQVLNEDGSINVVETWDVYVKDTGTLFKNFTLSNYLYGDWLRLYIGWW